MINYLKASLARKKARRVTAEYPPKIDRFDLPGIGTVEFANWTNPLIKPTVLNPAYTGFFQRFIKEGDLIIDIGANTGDTTVPMALCAGGSGLTLGFDPNPYVFKILEKNASLNPGKMNLVPVPFAITTEPEEFYFMSSEASFGNGAIAPEIDPRHGKFVHHEKVRGVNLKQYLESNYKEWLPKFSFIKIDTEGYDKEIIKSISDLLKEYRPVMIAESFGKSSEAAKRELFDVIHQCGYRMFYFEDFRLGAPEKEIKNSNDLVAFTQTINIYCIP